MPDSDRKVRVFLSYARGDDEDFVKRLCAALKEAGFTVWFDRESLMSRGLTFHQEIRDAIRCEVDRVVYVGGPKAAASPYVREEWQLGLEFDHVVVTPIFRIGKEENVPGEIGLLHCEDFRDDAQYPASLAKLIASLRQPNPKLGALKGVPDLPPHFLARPELMRRVKDALLVDLQTAQVITGSDARVGMQGMGGIGKSVLATALARNREVRQSYPDGVVWIGFGQHLTNDDLLSRLRELVRQFGGEDAFQSIPEGQGVLRETLQAKAVLLVMDDVWHAADAKVFDHLGPRCRMLVTTRDAGILHTLHGELVPVSLFTEVEALQLLADAVGVEVSALPAEAREVADECGLLPLALALSGGMAKAGHSWQDIVEALREADLEWAEDREGVNENHRTIWNAMKASYDALPDEQKPRFAELAVFAPDLTVPEAAVQTLWEHTGQLSGRHGTKLLINLAERSLIQLDQKADADGKIQLRLSLHDLLHDYATRTAGEPRALHQSLLDAYRRKCSDGWASGPDDGYFLSRLPFHLHACKLWQDLNEVVHAPRFTCLKRWVDQGETDAALKYLPPLVDYLIKSKFDVGAGASLATQLGRVHIQTGNYAAAEASLRQALKCLPWHKGLRTKAVAYHELGSVRLYLGDRASANKLYHKALWIGYILGPRHRDEVAANQIAIATLWLLNHNSEKALHLANQALSLASAIRDYAHVVSAHRIIALSSKNMLEFSRAATHLAQAVELASVDGLWLLRCQLTIDGGWFSYARAVLEKSSVAPAVGLFENARRAAEQSGDATSHIEACLGLVWCNLLSGEVTVAETALAVAVVMAGIGNTSLLALAKLGSALVEHHKGSTQVALPLYKAALDYSRQHHELECACDSLVGIGAISFHQGSPEMAADSWCQAAALAQKCSPLRMKLVAVSIENCRRSDTETPR